MTAAIAPQAVMGIALAVALLLGFIVGADSLDRRDRREERAAARSSRQEAARSSTRERRQHRGQTVGRALTAAEAGGEVVIALGGAEKPPGMTVEEWITDVLGPAPETDA